MLDIFTVSFREALQCLLLAYLILTNQSVIEDRKLRLSSLAGFLVSVTGAYLLSYLLFTKDIKVDIARWSFWQFFTELLIYYLSVPLMLVTLKPSRSVVSVMVFLLSFSLVFFDIRALGFYVLNSGYLKENVGGALGVSLLGMMLGFSPLLLYPLYRQRLHFLGKAVTWPVTLVFAGAFRVATGGLGEIAKDDLVVRLNNGFGRFLEDTVRVVQKELMLQKHPFLKTPYSRVFDFLSSDRMSMTLTVLALLAPVVFVLVRLFSTPDPLVYGLEGRAEKRLQIARSRRLSAYRAILPFIGFFILLVSLHTSSVTINPLYDPTPLTVRAEDSKSIFIPFKGKLGDLSDGRLHKYVYFWGNKQIVFLAILKSDGSVGVALDQCVICRPASWNKDAQGYAQKGKYLVCKYCMTPVLPDTVNKPGGCNPIPLPFKMTKRGVLISVDDLVRVYSAAEKLDKRGM